MQSIIKDVNFSFRSLIARPIYTLIALLTLALGIGVTTTMFTLVNSILLKPLPMPESEQLMILSFENQTKSKSGTGFQFSNFLQMEKVDGVFESMTFWVYDQITLTQDNSNKPLSNLRTSSEYFRVMDVQPLMGRWYNDADRGKNNILISYDLWVEDFQESSSIIGRSIQLDSKPHTIIGVMPKGFSSTGDLNVKVWNLLEGINRPGGVIARLKANTDQDTAQRQIIGYNRILNQNRSDQADVWQIRLTSMVESLTIGFRPALMLLLLSVFAVFLIAVLNVVNLTFAQYSNRAQELAIRVSVGATRRRLIRQLLIESLLLSIGGGVVGLLVAAWGLELVKYLAPIELPRIYELSLDLEAVVTIVFLMVMAGLFTTLIPSYSLVNPKKLSIALKQAGRKVTGDQKSNRIRRTLVALEVSVAVALLIGAGLLLRSYTLLIQQAPGFNSEGIIAGHVWLPDQFGSPARQYEHWQTLLDEFAKLPGVEAAAATTTLPMMPTGIDFDVIYTFAGAPETLPGEEPQAAIRSITGSYFETLQIPLLAGREFDERDVANAPRVVVINRELAKKLWSEESALDRELILPNWMGGAHRIIGIVENVKHRALSASIKPEFYIPFTQAPYAGMSFIVKAPPSQHKTLARILSNLASSIATTAPMINISSLEKLTINSVLAEKLMLSILAIFAALALFLASIGVYGISDNMVNQRTNEIGIRMALGARPKNILHWILWDSSRPVVAGVLIGLLVVGLAGTLLSSLLFGITAWDPVTYFTVPFTLLVVAVLAAWIPAKRATRIQPQEALYYE